MTIGTHYLLAKRLFPLLKERYDENFSQEAFILGNIWPDLSPRLRAKSHNMEELGPEIVRYAHLACHPGSSPFAVGMALGITCHCIADIFNLAHNSPQYKRKVRAHLGYEMSQNRHFKSCQLSWRPAPLSPENARRHVEALHRDFLSVGVTHDREWALTTQVSLDLCAGVLRCREETAPVLALPQPAAARSW